MTKLKKGSKGADVKQVQEMLNKAGAKPKVKADGNFGAKTETAVKAFQKKNRLKEDGVIGTKSMAVLKKKGGGAAKAQDVPEWPHGDMAKRIKAIESNTKELVASSKRNLMEMDQNLNDFDIEKIRNKYFDNLRSYLAIHKKWMSDAQKVLKFQRSFEKLAARNPAAGPEIIKAAANTLKNMEKTSQTSEKFLFENCDLVDKFKAMSTKKAA